VSESVVSAKRSWVSFGAKPAQSETPVRAAAKRRPPGRGRSGMKMRSLPLVSVRTGSWIGDTRLVRSVFRGGLLYNPFRQGDCKEIIEQWPDRRFRPIPLT
jgi:hypothetical protein